MFVGTVTWDLAGTYGTDEDEMGKRRSQRHKAKATTTEDDVDAAGGVKADSGEANVGVGSEHVVTNAATFPSSCDDNSTEGDSFIGDLTMPMVGSIDNSAIPESSPLLLSSCKDDVSGDVNPTTTGETIIQDDGSISVRTPLITNLSRPQSAVDNEEKQTKSSIVQRSSRKKATTRRGMEVWIDGSWVNVNDHLNDVESVVVGDASTGDENESRWNKLLRKISARCCCKQRS
jgi:hypothetical protein